MSESAVTTDTPSAATQGVAPGSAKTVALLLCLFAAVFNTSAFVLQKKSFTGRGSLRQRACSVILLALGESLNFAAYAFASAPLVTTLGVFTVYTTILAASRVMDEPFRKYRDSFGLVCITLGTIGAVISAPPVVMPSSRALRSALVTPAFMLFAGFVLGAMCFLCVWWRGARDNSPLGVFVGLCTIASLGSVTAVKILSATLLGVTLEPDLLIVALLLLLFSLPPLLYTLGKANKLFHVSAVVPFYFVTFNMATIALATTLYGELRLETPGEWVLFIFSVSLNFTGIRLVAAGRRELFSATDRAPPPDSEWQIVTLDEPRNPHAPPPPHRPMPPRLPS